MLAYILDLRFRTIKYIYRFKSIQIHDKLLERLKLTYTVYINTNRTYNSIINKADF